jgi:hypothetical protein
MPVWTGSGTVIALDAIRIARAAGATLNLDGPSLVIEAENQPPPQVLDLLRAHKPEILELLRAERQAIIRYVNDHFQSSPLDRCAYCGGDESPVDPFVVLFCGADRAGVHAGCHQSWIAVRESEARDVLGLEPSDKEGRHAG